jgi:hypothetical protein
MSAIVLLNFTKKSEAAAFVRALYSEEPDFGTIGQASFAGDVVATVGRPDAYCTCAGQRQDEPRGRKRRSRPARELSYTKEPKNGWWVCIHCGLPSKAIYMHFVTSMLVGLIDHTPKILGRGEPTTLFEQRIIEVVEQAARDGVEADLESLSAPERAWVQHNPDGVLDPRHGNTALNGGGVSRRSTKGRRTPHPRRG